MNDFNKFIELLLMVTEKMKENNSLKVMYYWALGVFGGSVLIHSIASLVEAFSKLL